jgi:hypothetical protein
MLSVGRLQGHFPGAGLVPRPTGPQGDANQEVRSPCEGGVLIWAADCLVVSDEGLLRSAALVRSTMAMMAIIAMVVCRYIARCPRPKHFELRWAKNGQFRST